MTKEAVQLPLPGFDQAFGQWRSDYAQQIGEDRAVENRSGLEVKPLYTPRDWDGENYLDDLGFPGQYPTRVASIRRCIGAGPGRNAS
jgi:methylmalonyl-CoA mutase, N-terminal domain